MVKTAVNLRVEMLGFGEGYRIKPALGKQKNPFSNSLGLPRVGLNGPDRRYASGSGRTFKQKTADQNKRKNRAWQ